MSKADLRALTKELKTTGIFVCVRVDNLLYTVCKRYGKCVRYRNAGTRFFMVNSRLRSGLIDEEISKIYYALSEQFILCTASEKERLCDKWCGC